MHARIFTDDELVDQTREGLRTGFEELVRRYYPKCIRFAVGILGDMEEAEEAVQDAFLKVYVHIESYRREAKFSTWLYRILYNICHTRLRLRRSFVDISAVEDRYDNRLLEASDETSLIERLEQKDIVEAIIKAFDELPSRYRSVLHLHYIEDFTVEEIGRILRISESAVKVRLYRGRILIRNKLSMDLGSDLDI